jgi:hypothetical protein
MSEHVVLIVSADDGVVVALRTSRTVVKRLSGD